MEGSSPVRGESGAPESAALARLLRGDRRLATVARRAGEHRLQIVVGRVERSADGTARLVQEGFRAGAEYLYPASTVKLLVAAAALERLGELRSETGLALTADTPMTYHPLFDGEGIDSRDPTHLDGGRITIGHELRKIFLVSDNEAFNRLYEFVGPDRLAASLERAGLGDIRIVHRLSEARTPEENLRTPEIEFVGGDFRYTQPARTAAAPGPMREVPGLDVGRAHLAGGERVDAPFDMRGKNRAPLTSQQRALCSIVLPEVDCGARGFQLTEADRRRLRRALGELPRESEDPRLDAGEYPDEFVKFVLPGVRAAARAAGMDEDALRVYDKSGEAYGFLLDNAYVENRETGHGYFVAAAIYANADGTVNDDQYEYDTIARPFLAALAERLTTSFLTP